MSSLLVGPVADAVVIEFAAFGEAVEAVAAVQLMLFVMGDGMGEAPASRRRRLEALIAPTAVEIEVADRRAADEGAAIRRHVLDAGPMAQQAEPRDRRDQRDGAFRPAEHTSELQSLMRNSY